MLNVHGDEKNNADGGMSAHATSGLCNKKVAGLSGLGGAYIASITAFISVINKKHYIMFGSST